MRLFVGGGKNKLYLPPRQTCNKPANLALVDQLQNKTLPLLTTEGHDSLFAEGQKKITAWKVVFFNRQ